MTTDEITEFLKRRGLPYPDRGDSASTVLEKFGEILCFLILEKEKLNGHVDTDWGSRNNRGG